MDGIESATVRINRLEKSVDLLSEKNSRVEIQQAAIDEKVSCILTTLNEVKNTVNGLQLAPVKRWNLIIGAAISSLVSMLTGVIVGRLFL